MKVEELKKNLQNNQIKNLYVFVGEEEFLIRSYLQRFRDLLPQEMIEFNLSEVEGEVTLTQLTELVTPYPMLSDNKLVIVRDSGLLSAYDKQTEEFLSNIPDYAIVIFTEQLPSKVGKKLMGIFEDKWDIVDFSKRDAAQLQAWIALKLKGAEKVISKADCDYLIQLCDSAMSKLDLELDKMISYVGERSEITKKDIEEMLPPDNNFKIYELSDRVLSGKKTQAYEILRELKQSAEPIAVLAEFFTQLNFIAMVKNLKQDGERIDEFFPPNRRFLAKKIASTCGKYSYDKVRRAMTSCAQYDADVKMGRIDGWTAVELVMASL